jgi:hypothetical protein
MEKKHFAQIIQASSVKGHMYTKFKILLSLDSCIIYAPDIPRKKENLRIILYHGVL